MRQAKSYWKDIRQSFSNSKGRVVSIASLMALGSFALVGLKVTAPNMRTAADDFFRQHQTADLFILSDYGLDATDQALLEDLDDEAAVELGYFQDVVIEDSTQAVRLFSAPETLSTYDLVAGRLPEQADEIALAGSFQADYQLGERLTVTEKANSDGQTILTETSFTIVGFANSSEILSTVNQGPSQAGSGELQGYGIVAPSAFDSDLYLLARVAYDDLRDLSPYSQTYLDGVLGKKAELKDLLAEQPQARLSAITSEGQAELDKGQVSIDQAKADLTKAEQELAAAKAQLEAGRQALPAQVVAATEAELAKQSELLATKQAEAAKELPAKQAELDEAQAKLDSLTLPTYQVYTRREVPGSEGYISYENNASIIEAVSNVFPVVLYLVAALVTANTMARFVDEERLKSGTLRALGYDRKDILRKFLLYGAVTSLVGTVIGTVAGHLLLPKIVYGTYSSKLVVAAMPYHFYPGVTVMALILGLVSALLPAYLVARKTLAEKPAQLLLPKPPASGSTILLERLGFVWSRLTFTQKVTARNIFRYKQRMLMTIFGVAGSVALLFAGLGVRHSISDLSQRQFSDIITYDLIVAEKDQLTSDETTELEDYLDSSAISQNLPIHYETVTKEAGASRDSQDITLLAVAEGQTEALSAYLRTADRQSGERLTLSGEGVLVSEKLARLAGVAAGDSLSVEDSQGRVRELPVAGVTEMYMGHFILMTDGVYEAAFDKDFATNAQLVQLTDETETEQVAAEMMALPGVKGVVQNTTLKNQVVTIVEALGRIMGVLIGSSVLLAVVILYNLTNINVAERLRELSTVKVLGFHDKEVTLYIYRETILLSLIGIGAGFGLGHLLAGYMLEVIPPAGVMFNPAVPAMVYLVPTVVILLVIAGLGFWVHGLLKKVDMLEALKSVE